MKGIFMSFLEKIFDKIELDLKEANIDIPYKVPRKSFWNSLSNIKDINIFRKIIIEAFEKIKEEKFKNYNDTTTDISKRLQVTFKNSLPYRQEEALERILAIVNDESQNQLTIPDGGHVDIEYSNQDGHITFVELKTVNIKGKYYSNTPIHALIESLKNKYLIEKLSKTKCEHLKTSYNKKGINTVQELTILAPFEYYKHYAQKQSIETLYSLKNLFDVDINFKYLDVQVEEIENLMEFIYEKAQIINKDNNEVISFDENKDVIFEYLKKNNLQDKLLQHNWKTLDTVDKWISLK